MSMTVQENSLGLSVFGTAQVDYSVAGESGLTYDQAVARMGLRRATAIESTLGTYTAVVKARQKKTEDLAAVMANIAGGIGGADPKKGDNPLKQNINIGGAAYGVLSAYGLIKNDTGLAQNGDIQLGDLQKLQTDVQYALDINDNDIQQDAATLQSLVQKRDNAYSMATKLMKKANQTRSNGIKYIG